MASDTEASQSGKFLSMGHHEQLLAAHPQKKSSDQPVQIAHLALEACTSRELQTAHSHRMAVLTPVKAA